MAAIAPTKTRDRILETSLDLFNERVDVPLDRGLPLHDERARVDAGLYVEAHAGGLADEPPGVASRGAPMPPGRAQQRQQKQPAPVSAMASALARLRQ